MGILEGDEALNLFKAGRNEWNKWASAHTGYKVSFRKVDFSFSSPNRDSFSGFIFPGDVDFCEAIFRELGVDFTASDFSNGTTSFSCAVFTGGEVSFREAKFNNNVDFGLVDFGCNTLSFENADFGTGFKDFRGTNFPKKGVCFRNTYFGNGRLDFVSAMFMGGKIDFAYSKICADRLNLRDIKLDKGTQGIDLSSSEIDSVIDLSGIESVAIVDLTQSKLSFPINLEGANIDFIKEKVAVFFKRSVNRTDSAAFRRLKKLSTDSGDTTSTIGYFANEMRASYWHSITGGKLFLYYLYDWFSDYGRSIRRPLICLLTVWFMFAVIYANLSNELIDVYAFSEALYLSVGHTIPFYITSKSATLSALNFLFDGPSHFVNTLLVMQGVISSIFLFLLALGVRNRFRSR